MSAIDWASGVPAHVQIAAVLRAQIDDGTLSAGQRLPDRDALGVAFDVSHMTVSKALGILRDEKRIVYKPGRGLFVLAASARR